MATGDLNNNIDKARNELTGIRYDGAWNSLGISEGSPEAYLPLIHYVCVNFSRFLARFLASKGYELVGKNDMRFMEEVYKILRNEFNYRPALNLSQFFTIGFAERKLILVCDLIKLCKRKHNEISKQKADAKRKTVSSPSASLLRPPSPQVNTSKRDDPDTPLRKSGGSFTKSGSLESSQRRRSGSTGSNGTPTVPKKFVASASLVNNEIDVVDFRPNVSAARPPIRVIRNEPKQPLETSSTLNLSSHTNHIPTPSHPSHPSHTSTPSHSTHPNHASSSSMYSPTAPAPSFTAPSNPSYASPAHFNPSYPNPSFYTPPSNPSFAPSNPPLPSSSAYASRSADGAWRMQDATGPSRYARAGEETQHAQGYAAGPSRYARGGMAGEEHDGTQEANGFTASSRYARGGGGIGEEVLEVEDVEAREEEEVGEEGEEEGEEGLPEAFRELRANMNGRMEGGEKREEGGGKREKREKKEDNGYSGASTGHFGSGGEGPVSDKVAMHILDRLSLMETKVLSSINTLQTSVISLESRVKNLESLLGDSSPKRAIFQAPQQPTFTNNPNKHTMNYHTSTSSPPSSSPLSAQPPLSYPAYPTLSHSPPSSHSFSHSSPSTHSTYQFQDHAKYPTNNIHPSNNISQNTNFQNNMHSSNLSGFKNDGNGSNSDNSSTSSNNEKLYKPTTQSTQDFISSITKRFKDTRELLDQQSKLQPDK